ncbi:MAG: Cthe_2314 family HEPN domain-containing protein [Sphaerochaetaceae bacterium]|jgi:hypothetical protein|nr:Cthe_2314 family HEPN domain-containing protein [Sphaerochaetaceae bacterium]
MGEIRIEGSFELLSQDEWNEYLEVDLFNEMRLDMARFGVSTEGMPDLSHPKLAEMIQQHNNKVGSLAITYALARHYFDKGIPDDPWYISPGKKGQSIQYFPEFQEEHWMRRYWFNYFSDTFYLKISSIWDSMIEILNHFYGLDYPNDLRLRSKVIDWLKQNANDVASVFVGIMQETLYVEAQFYRTLAAHGTSAASVVNTVESKKDEWVDIIDHDANGKMLFDESGKPVMKKVKAKAVISMRVGDYVNVATILKNMEDYSRYSGQKIQEIVGLILD